MSHNWSLWASFSSIKIQSFSTLNVTVIDKTMRDTYHDQGRKHRQCMTLEHQINLSNLHFLISKLDVLVFLMS